jgi:sugar phosphate isomerase/epimerase
MEKKIRLCAFSDEASVDLKGQINALLRNGISMMEIRGVDGENIKDISYSKIKEIGKALKENGLGVWSIGSPVGKYKVDDNFDGQLDDFKRLCEYAELLECEHIRMFSFFTKNEDEALSCLGKMCEAAPKNIIMCHENEKGIFGDKYEDCVRIHEAYPQIKAVFDPANFIQCKVDTLKAWDALSPYVEYMHIKDAMADGRVVRAGHGIGNVEKIVDMYTKGGGEVLTLEPHLMEFTGLKNLENGESLNGIPVYNDTNEAFDAGVSALKEILDRLNLRY